MKDPHFWTAYAVVVILTGVFFIATVLAPIYLLLNT